MKAGVVVRTLAVTALCCAAVGATAAWGGASASVGVHEHGVADLTVAVEGQTVDLVLTLPSADLVGLERAPTSEQERASIRQRVAALEAGSWFLLGDGRCEQVSVEVTLPAIFSSADTVAEGGEGGEGDGDHDHGDHGHGNQNAAEDQQHMDGMVAWQYRCESGARLRQVDVRLFELLPLARIRTRVISQRGQGAATLTPAARRLSLP